MVKDVSRGSTANCSERTFAVAVVFSDSEKKIAGKISEFVRDEEAVLLCVGAGRLSGDSLDPLWRVGAGSRAS